MQSNLGQLSLDLLESPPRPEAAVWRQLSAAEHQAAVTELAGMILAAALGTAPDQLAAKQVAVDKTNPDPIAPDRTERQSADA